MSGYKGPSSKSTETAMVPFKTCPYCKGVVAPGISHVCTRMERHKNVVQMVKSLSERSKNQVLSQSLREIKENTGSSSFSLSTRGAPLPVHLGRKVDDDRMFTNEDSRRLQNERHFTDNDMKAIERANRVVYGRKAVEAGARETRVDLNHSLEMLFEKKVMKLKYKPKKKKDDDDDDKENECPDEEMELDDDGLMDIVRPVVLCKDTKEFLATVMMHRNIFPEDTFIKVGADDGQGIFKICVQLLSKEPKSESGGRSSYGEGVAPKTHKEGSVHKLFMLLAVPKVQELYFNLKVLFGELGLDGLEFLITSDIKIVLVLLGKDSGSCIHACPFCEDGKPWKSTGSKLNTIGSLQKWHEDWLDDGGIDKRSKSFQNMRHPPLIHGDPNTVILDQLGPPQLHLMLGTNIIYLYFFY